MPFRNREEAADLLTKRLEKFRGVHPVVLAIPRGAVHMGRLIADNLGCDLDVVLVRKIGAPDEPELALGSIAENGEIFLNDFARTYPRDVIEQKADEAMALIKKRRQKYSTHHKPIALQGRVVIIVDDGVATGATVLSAIHAVKKENPKTVVVATPVAPPRVREKLSRECDEFIILSEPEEFFSVGQFYKEFPQVQDEEVSRYLYDNRP